MDWWLANFFIGAIFSLFLPLVPDLFVLILLLLISLWFFCFSAKHFVQGGFSVTSCTKGLRLSSGLLFGATWMLFNAYNFQHLWQDNKVDVISLSNKTQWVQGEVLSLLPWVEQAKESGSNSQLTEEQRSKTLQSNNPLRFNLLITRIDNTQLAEAIQLRLSWKNATLLLQQGQIVNLRVKIKPSHGLANQGGFSYQTWLNSNKISATGYVLNHKDNVLLSSKNTFRQQLFNDYSSFLVKNHAKHELSPLLLALGFGSRTALSKDNWQVLQITGTGHLIAISGLHIGLVATGCFYLVMWLVRLLPLSLLANNHKLQTINLRYFAIGLSMLAALSYGYLAGFSLPTVRALVMLSLYWLTRLLGIHVSVKRWLLLTLFVITITTPFSLFTASFWLSVYAVTVIFLTLWRFKYRLNQGHVFWRFIKGLFVIQLSLTVMLLPISAIFFQQISLVALVANIIAVPWMSFISIPLCLLSVLIMPVSEYLSQFLITLCLASIGSIWEYLTYLSTLPWAVKPLSTVEIQLLVFTGGITGLWLFIQPRYFDQIKRKNTVTAVVTLVIVILGFLMSNKPFDRLNHWQVIVFDVGQGLSVLVQRDKKAILYDTGASYESGFNMVEAVVLPYLQHAGITQLDKVIISHSDNDHAGGLSVLQDAIEIKELIYNTNHDSKEMGISNSIIDNGFKNKATMSACLQGKAFIWQELTFEMLWPEQEVAKDNDDSCVLLISDNKHKVLLTGDISKTIENKLVKKYPTLQANVLIVPHHGSKTSSSEAFITQLKPTLAVVSAGFLNRWRMPVTEVVDRYTKENIQLLNSADSGQITIGFSKDKIQYYTYGEDLWPFWFAKSP